MDSIHTQDILLIEAYLTGILADSEKKVVRERLQSDPDFTKLYEMIRSLPDALRRCDLQEKMEAMNRLDAQEDEP